MANITQLCTVCQKERKRFSTGDKHSPGCTELWRLAFTKDDDAWVCIMAIFEPLLTRFCKAAVDKAPWFSGLISQDVRDIVQDVWHNLWRYVERNQAEALGLLVEGDISRIIGLLKTIVKNRVVELGRKPHSYEEPLLEEDGQEGEGGGGRKPKSLKMEMPNIEGKIDLERLLRSCIQTEQEYIIAEMMILQGMKPRDVYDLRPDKFASPEEVYQVRQTLLRRIRGNSARRNLGGPASLQYRFDQANEVHMEEKSNIFEPCPFDEGLLLDYLNGYVDLETKAAIESSPVCVQAAVALQADLAIWRPALRQMFCPDSEQLVAYQERRFKGTEYLVVYNHIQQCPCCRAEIEMLAAVDYEPQPSLARRIIDLIFQPATTAPVPVLGEGSYRTIERTPQIELFVSTSRTAAKQGNWMIFGRLRYEGDQPVTHIESIVLQDIDDEDAPELSTSVDETGAFTVKGLDAGVYRIRIIRAEEEIILHEFKVGDEL